MEEILLISDAAKRVQVENHVLRYWEEELKLPIKRNEAGHRYYTQEDIERFMQIKSMKERGLQLKAIKMILKDGKLDVLSSNEAVQAPTDKESDETRTTGGMAIEIVHKGEIEPCAKDAADEKMKRLQWLLKQLFKEALQENNQELAGQLKENIVKELNYQFLCQEEREAEREKLREKRSEEYYQRMDALLRKKSNRIRPEKEKGGKKKRHLSF